MLQSHLLQAWINCFKDCAGLHNVLVSGEAAIGAGKAAEKFPAVLK
jgi:hypothetical protein